MVGGGGGGGLWCYRASVALPCCLSPVSVALSQHVGSSLGSSVYIFLSGLSAVSNGQGKYCLTSGCLIALGGWHGCVCLQMDIVSVALKQYCTFLCISICSLITGRCFVVTDEVD